MKEIDTANDGVKGKGNEEKHDERPINRVWGCAISLLLFGNIPFLVVGSNSDHNTFAAVVSPLAPFLFYPQ